MTITINDRVYAMPAKPAVVICLDGCEPDYIDAAIAAGVMPAVEKIIAEGTRTLARSAMPSFTNPNNLSIATGVPSLVHGICGNFFLNPETGESVMMNSAEFLRAPTIFAGYQKAGTKVAVVTAKDKLRELLGAGLDCTAGAICFSAEKADKATASLNGIDDAATWLNLPVPAVYSGDLSIFVLEAGVKLLEEMRPDILYLSTSDYVQHKHAPGTAEANAFMAEVDAAIAGLIAQDVRLVLTADHGMRAKHTADGAPDVIYLKPVPDVIYLKPVLEDLLGAGNARVILPITDPYVAHHGALGSFATIHLSSDDDVERAVGLLKKIDGMDQVLTGAEACDRFDLPADRIGDLVVTSLAGKALGTAEVEHDLSGLDVPLRSHGGLDEQVVPFIVNGPMGDRANVRNYDAWITAVASA